MIKRAALVLASFFSIVLLLMLEHQFIFTLLRLPEMRAPYLLTLSFLLLVSLTIFSFRKKISIFRTLVLGILAGQVCGTISLSFANLFIPNGIQRNLASLQRDGFVEIFLTDTIVAAILGAWILGGIGFLVYRFLEERFSAREHSQIVEVRSR